MARSSRVKDIAMRIYASHRYLVLFADIIIVVKLNTLCSSDQS